MLRLRSRLWLLVGLSLVASAPRGAQAEATPPRVDLTRIRVEPSGATAPTSDGHTARLSIDPKLQRTADRLLARANPVEGAAIVVDARSGRVLVWSERRRASDAPGSVLLAAKEPSASLFKLVTTAALLTHGGVNPKQSVCIAGGERRIERRHLEPPRGGEIQCNSFGTALGHSRNAAYAQLATRHLMRSDLVYMAERMGLNAKVPFDADLEAGRVTVPYNDLEFARTAAGFGDAVLSPLGALQLASIVALSGQRLQFRIVDAAGSYVAPKGPVLGERVLEPAVATTLRRMMEVTVHSGTSLEAFGTKDGKSQLGRIRAAGKTGTLRVAKADTTTTWFVGFAPSHAPELLVSVMLSNGPVWRQKANELGRDLMRAWFAERRVSGVSHPLDAAIAEAPPLQAARPTPP
ncbi:MAG: hypothetical protein KF718_08505 [Polyangiaceae bacterium]|nr:hypothetical protein [Polyangiaceae bacterium]